MRAISRKLFRVLLSNRFSPIDMMEIRLPGSTVGSTIRLTNAGESITWNSSTFKPVQFGRGSLDEILATEAGTVPSASVIINNVDTQMAGLLNSAELEQSEVVMYLADRRLLAEPRDAITMFVGSLRNPVLNERTFTFDVVNIMGMMEGIEIPRRFYQTKCNYRFGAPWCGVDLSASPNSIHSTTQAGTNEYVIALPGSVASTIGGDANNNWLEGYILMKDGPAALQWREIYQIDVAGDPDLWFVRSPYLIHPGTGSGCIVRRGCPRTPDACAVRQPSATSDNFGGFPNVPYGHVPPVRFEEPTPHSV